MTRIELDPVDEPSRELWCAVGDLADRLPGEWVLIGGLMVQLHVVQAAGDVRTTVDIDVLAQARPPGTLESIDSALRAEGFRAEGPDRDGYGYRYRRDGLVVDVLAPDGIKPPPRLNAGTKAVSVPGGSQALARAETVTVVLGDRAFGLQRPTLLGAILIKARSLMVHSDPAAQREDLLRLLAIVDDPRAMAAEMRASERRWLRRAQTRLDLDAPSTLDPDSMRLARLAFGLLCPG